MKVNRILLIFFVCNLLFLFQACANPTSTQGDFSNIKKSILPTQPGVYYLQGRNLKEISPEKGNGFDFHKLTVFENNQPEFIIYEQKNTSETFLLYDHMTIAVPLIIAEIEDPNERYDHVMVQVKPAQPLDDGFYCFSEDYFFSPAFNEDERDKKWCFGLGDNHRLGVLANENSYSLPGDQTGFYLVNDGELEQIPSIDSNAEIDIDLLPRTNQLLPTILFISPEVDPDSVQIYWQRFVIGISSFPFSDQFTITKVDKNSGAEKVGMLPGDVILGVNGIDVTTWLPIRTRNLMAVICSKVGTIDLTILRGTKQFIAQPECSLGLRSEIGKFIYSLDPKGFALFRNTYPLYPKNVYCLSASSSSQFCFLVN